MTTPNDEWRALDSRTRRVIMRHARDYRAHPDPAVSALAARYARWYLDARTWHARYRRLALGLVIADVTVTASVMGWLSGGPAADKPSALEMALIWLAAGMIMLAVLAPYIVRKYRIIQLCRLELANTLALESATPAGSAGPAPVTGQGVSVRYNRRRVAWQSAWTLGIVCCGLALFTVRGLSSPGAATALAVLYWLLFIFVLFRMWTQVLRWAIPGNPIVELDAEGVHMPSIPYDLPWALLAEVRLFPVRYARRDGQEALVVAFVPQDSSVIPRGGRKHKRLERSLRVYGTPLSVCDKIIDHSGEQIAAAATTFATVPVRRY